MSASLTGISDPESILEYLFGLLNSDEFEEKVKEAVAEFGATNLLQIALDNKFSVNFSRFRNGVEATKTDTLTLSEEKAEAEEIKQYKRFLDALNKDGNFKTKYFSSASLSNICFSQVGRPLGAVAIQFLLDNDEEKTFLSGEEFLSVTRNYIHMDVLRVLLKENEKRPDDKKIIDLSEVELNAQLLCRAIMFDDEDNIQKLKALGISVKDAAINDYNFFEENNNYKFIPLFISHGLTFEDYEPTSARMKNFVDFSVEFNNIVEAKNREGVMKEVLKSYKLENIAPETLKSKDEHRMLVHDTVSNMRKAAVSVRSPLSRRKIKSIADESRLRSGIVAPSVDGAQLPIYKPVAPDGASRGSFRSGRLVSSGGAVGMASVTEALVPTSDLTPTIDTDATTAKDVDNDLREALPVSSAFARPRGGSKKSPAAAAASASVSSVDYSLKGPAKDDDEFFHSDKHAVSYPKGTSPFASALKPNTRGSL